MTTHNTISVLLIEDSPTDQILFQAHLQEVSEPSFIVETREELSAGLDRLCEGNIDIVLLDLGLPDSQGLQTLKSVIEAEPSVPVVVLTGIEDESVGLAAVRDGAQDYLIKNRLDSSMVARSIRYSIERQRTMQALADARSYSASVVDALSESLLVLDDQFRVLSANPAFFDTFRLDNEQVLGLVFWELADGDWNNPMLRDYLTGSIPGTSELELELEFKKQGKLIVQFSARKIQSGNLLLRIEDVTDRRNLEKQLQMAHKMEAVGRLAAGVAHDFNNLLTVIVGFSDVLLTRNGLDTKQRESVAKIKRAGERATSLTHHLLAFSRKQILAPAVLDLNSLIGEMEKVLRRMLGDDIELLTSLHSGLFHVEADPAQMENVLVNLALNARDAMPTGGRLTIETQNVMVDSQFVEDRPEITPGRYAMIAVSDTGNGMDEDVRSRVFEPFFSTKEPGKGTGLGLAMVYGTVRQSGGFIYLYSEPGKGTSFKIYLPRVESESTNGRSSHSEMSTPRGSETVLLVEDAEDVLVLASLAMKSHGYRVLAARNGEHAIRVWEETSGAIDMLITDVVMPKMSGRRLAELLRERAPDLKILYTSGYTDEAVIEHGVDRDGNNFLQKPYTPMTLVRKARDVLDRHPETANA